MSDVLIDSSAWVAFFRGEEEAVRRIDPLLADGRVAIAGPIFAELLSGVPNRKSFDRLKTLLHSLDWLVAPADLWDRISEARFALARMGYQASLIDLEVALTALDAGHALLTRDRDFARVRRVLPLDLLLF